MHFFVNYNPSTAFGEDECCWQEAVVDFSAQSQAEPLGMVRRHGTLWFCVAQQNECPCSSTIVAFQSFCFHTQEWALVEGTDPINIPMGANHFA